MILFRFIMLLGLIAIYIIPLGLMYMLLGFLHFFVDMIVGGFLGLILKILGFILILNLIISFYRLLIKNNDSLDQFKFHLGLSFGTFILLNLGSSEAVLFMDPSGSSNASGFIDLGDNVGIPLEAKMCDISGRTTVKSSNSAITRLREGYMIFNDNNQLVVTPKNSYILLPDGRIASLKSMDPGLPIGVAVFCDKFQFFTNGVTIVLEEGSSILRMTSKLEISILDQIMLGYLALSGNN